MDTRDAPPVFSARGLTKLYRTGEVEVRALSGVDLDVGRGEFIVLLGPSGSGKSTLLNILGGLDIPTTGEVRFGDHRLDGASEAELTRYRREHVGFVFQFYNLIPSLTARENVALVTEISRNPMDPDEALELVDLRRWEEWLLLLLGAWLAGSPAIFAYANDGDLRFWHVGLGLAIMVLAGLQFWQDRAASDADLAKHGR